MWLKSRFTCTFTHTCCFYSGSTHPHTSTHFRLQIHPKLFYSYPGENSQKHYPIPVIPHEINARDILVTTTCYIIPGGWVLWKKSEYEEIKRGKCLKPRREEKVRREVKMDKCPIVELGVQDTHLREKKKKKIKSISIPSKVSKSKKGMYPLKRAQVELDFHHCFHHHHHTTFIRHTCTSWFDLLTCFSGSMVWLCNKCLVSMLLIFGNAVRNWSASARISVSTSPGMLSRVSYLYFYH